MPFRDLCPPNIYLFLFHVIELLVFRNFHLLSTSRLSRKCYTSVNTVWSFHIFVCDMRGSFGSYFQLLGLGRKRNTKYWTTLFMNIYGYFDDRLSSSKISYTNTNHCDFNITDLCAIWVSSKYLNWYRKYRYSILLMHSSFLLYIVFTYKCITHFVIGILWNLEELQIQVHIEYPGMYVLKCWSIEIVCYWREKNTLKSYVWDCLSLLSEFAN